MTNGKQAYIWHSQTNTLLPVDECIIVRLTPEELLQISEGLERPSEKMGEKVL